MVAAPTFLVNIAHVQDYTTHVLLLLQEPLFAARVIYDLLFFFMVIIIVLNLIFGVIIDTFADLRSEKQKKEEVLKTTCFICGEAVDLFIAEDLHFFLHSTKMFSFSY